MIILWTILACIVFYIVILSKRYSFAKELKKSESPIETKMLKALYAEGYKPIAQVPCRGYRIDIAVYANRKKIAIECDGKAFHSTPKQLQHDETKDRVLQKDKWVVLRFTGSDINRDAYECVRVVDGQLNRKRQKK